jgi:aerobic-type carbon monoxide dehydrogenase small subunit (CoxS/CutS family)
VRLVKELSLVINGRSVTAAVEPRLNLVDFLREHQYLTATHIGCEHGVCGACTVLVDGVPARSCLTFAVAADRAAITTLEGFDNDPVMNVLREKFSEHHALQCGFCTPGMLMTARDIITRIPDADEKRIRLELSGNLCRCTGYVGIVEAVQSALATVKASGQAQPSTPRPIGPAGSHPPATPKDFSRSPRPVEGHRSGENAVLRIDAGRDSVGVGGHQRQIELRRVPLDAAVNTREPEALGNTACHQLSDPNEGGKFAAIVWSNVQQHYASVAGPSKWRVFISACNVIRIANR